MSKLKGYEAPQCACCGQNTESPYTLSKGTIIAFIKIAKYIKAKGINVVHPNKEMVTRGFLSTTEYVNLKTLTAHGLLAHAEAETGNYVLTRKGLEFMKGETIFKHAIVSKLTGETLGYFDETKTVNVTDADKSGVYHEHLTFDIKAGRIINQPLVKNA